MKLLARVPVRVADPDHCSIHCRYLSDMRFLDAGWLCTLWLSKVQSCRTLRLSRDGRPLRCAACKRATKGSEQ